MALQTSGQISLSDIQGEFGGSAPTSLSEYYGAAAGIPASGQISISDFYGATSVILQTLSNSTNVNLSTVFGSDWASSVPKEIIIPSGVTIGGTGSSDALTAPSGMGGTLTITNAGNILGFGGTSGGNGGNAINIASANITVDNSGFIAGGGGGGGSGGQGGQGGGGYIDSGSNSSVLTNNRSCNSHPCPATFNINVGICGSNQLPVYRGVCQTGSCCMGDGNSRRCYVDCYNPTSGGSGGAGGVGGLGQGYNQSAGTGSSGSSGGTGSGGTYGAGSGGSGGSGANGASYGAAAGSGSSGSSGANGYSGNGSAGSAGASGGAAGAAVIYTAAYTMNNTGTLAGAA
jgi:hypothetical protein